MAIFLPTLIQLAKLNRNLRRKIQTVARSILYKLQQLRENKMNKVLEYDSLAGNHISDVAGGALALAMKEKKIVHFKFNDTDVWVDPKIDSCDGIVKRWEKDMEASSKAYREHPDRIKEAAGRERKEKAEREAVMVDNSATEAQMRESEVPWPKTTKQLIQYIESLTKRNQEYGTCVYSMSMAAVAAFNYVAGQLGVTGFQSSCADLDIIRRTRRMKGPFMLIKCEDALYPQYDIPSKISEAMEEWKPWLKEQAAVKLAEASGYTHHDVIAHWEKLAALEIETEKA
jgi:hypothetical protein